jgi:hypothetical protein
MLWEMDHKTWLIEAEFAACLLAVRIVAFPNLINTSP